MLTIVKEYAPDLVEQLEPLVRAELLRQWRVVADRTSDRPAVPTSPSVQERKCELARRVLDRGHGDWIDVRIERGALLAVARPWHRGALGYRVEGSRPEAIVIPAAIKTVSDALGWVCLSDVPRTRSGRAFRQWLLAHQRSYSWMLGMRRRSSPPEVKRRILADGSDQQAEVARKDTPWERLRDSTTSVETKVRLHRWALRGRAWRRWTRSVVEARRRC